jgi:TPR repeat protein
MAGNMHMTSGKHEKAIFWYERALEMDPDNNNAPGATYRLSLAYKYLGNTEKAKDSLKMSALLGFMEAELDLGENYWNGWDGFEKDLSEGKYWLKKAHENGSQDAEKICDCNL